MENEKGEQNFEFGQSANGYLLRVTVASIQPKLGGRRATQGPAGPLLQLRAPIFGQRLLAVAHAPNQLALCSINRRRAG